MRKTIFIVKIKAIFRILFSYEFILITGKRYKPGLHLTKASSDEVYKMAGEFLNYDATTEDAVNECNRILNETKNLF